MDTVTDLPPSGAAASTPSTRAFPGRPESVREARAFVAGVLAGSPAANDAVLITSELFTNAIHYSASCLPGSQVTVTVRPGAIWIKVHVINAGELAPCFTRRRGLGKGLQIVGQLASAFGVNGPDWWFTVPAGGAR